MNSTWMVSYEIFVIRAFKMEIEYVAHSDLLFE